MKALVLCAGRGSRMGSLCDLVPKPLLEVEGQSIVERTIARLANAGFDQVWVNLSYRGDQVRNRLGDGSRFGVRIRYLAEDHPIGTAATARELRSSGEQGPLLVHYGDILTEHPLGELWRGHEASRAVATILVHSRRAGNSVVTVGEGGRVEGFVERPVSPPRGEHWAFSGVLVMADAGLLEIPGQDGVDFPRDVFPHLVCRGQLQAVPVQGFRCAIDSAERLEQARHFYRGDRATHSTDEEARSQP